ncbi:MAG: VCBS repeat-containing protein, partial [Myxococcales bacterium]|nr:VCBS repeat-containing protein [Myxococcales bacterium]
ESAPENRPSDSEDAGRDIDFRDLSVDLDDEVQPFDLRTDESREDLSADTGAGEDLSSSDESVAADMVSQSDGTEDLESEVLSSDARDTGEEIIVPACDDDGVPDDEDAFPCDPNEWLDTDNDGIGNNADPDDDNDTLSDIEESEPGLDCFVTNPTLADSDFDGINDAQDPYPNDPYREFVLRQNDQGSIDLFLSNRNGTFSAPVQIGDPITDNDGAPLNYRFIQMGDFDGDGNLDFIAHSDPYGDDELMDVYFFVREDKEDEFEQLYIGTTDTRLIGTVADYNEDYAFDIVYFTFIERSRSTLDKDEAYYYTFLNNWANFNFSSPCAYGTTVEQGCMFVLQPVVDLSETLAPGSNRWVAGISRQSVNLNPSVDGHSDLLIYAFNNGGNAATDIFVLFGNGDGTFSGLNYMFTHNGNNTTGACQGVDLAGDQAPVNSAVFQDFNQDGVGDVLLGFDDDGDTGAAWTYFGTGAGNFSCAPIKAMDLAPTNGPDQPGRSSSARPFDFNQDGYPDIITGFDTGGYGEGTRGETRIYLQRTGDGELGTFGRADNADHPNCNELYCDLYAQPQSDGPPLNMSLFEHGFDAPIQLCLTSFSAE